MTHPRVWHDSSTCVTWLIHMCDMTHPGRHGSYSARLRTTNRRRPFQRRSLGVNLFRTPPPTLPSYIRTIHRDLAVFACACGWLAGRGTGGARQVILSVAIDFLSGCDVTWTDVWSGSTDFCHRFFATDFLLEIFWEIYCHRFIWSKNCCHGFFEWVYDCIFLNSFICVRWLIHVFVETHSRVWHDPFNSMANSTCVTRPI